MDIRKIKKLIELLEESGIAEIEIKEGEEGVRISRMPTGHNAQHVVHVPTLPMSSGGHMSPSDAAAAAAPAAPPAEAQVKRARGDGAHGRDVLCGALAGREGLREHRR